MIIGLTCLIKPSDFARNKKPPTPVTIVFVFDKTFMATCLAVPSSINRKLAFNNFVIDAFWNYDNLKK